MPATRVILHSAFVLALPVVVAIAGLSVASALLLVLLAVVSRWAIVLAGLVRPARSPELVLETISASHYVEKVRWCMDRLGLDYVERPSAGTLGAFYLGRTVPRLNFRTGVVRSAIGNSREILRYLWGAWSGRLGKAAAFLEPTPERLRLESRIDRCGVNLQVWTYYHILGDAELCKYVWGAEHPKTPWWQRRVIRLAFPLQAWFIRRTFRTDEGHYLSSRKHIEALMEVVEARLADGRRSILGDAEINFTDLAFAAIVGIWLQPDGYGGGAGIRIERSRMPMPMQADIEGWIEGYPRVTAFITRLYADERDVRAGHATANEVRET